MKSRNLIILIVLAALLGGLAFMQNRMKQKKKPSLAAKILEDLDVNEVTKMVLYTDGDTVTVARVEGKWSIPERYDYPADFGKVADTLRALRELKTGQRVPVTDEQLTDLQLRSPLEPQAEDDTFKRGTLLELYDAKENKLSSLLLGKEFYPKNPKKPGMGGGLFGGGGYQSGRYVKTDKGDVLLLNKQLSDLTRKRKDWLDAKFISASAWDLMEIDVTGPDREAIHLKRESESRPLELPNLDDKHEMAASEVGTLSRALNYLKFNDVADPTLPDEQTGLDEPIVYKAKAKDGRIYTLQIGKAPEGSSDRYVRLGVEYVPPPEKEEEEPAQDEPAVEEEEPAEGEPDKELTEEEKKKAEEEKARTEAERQRKEEEKRKAEEKKREEREKLAKETKELNEHLGKWIYLVASSDVNDMTIKKKDLVKDKEEEKKTEDENDD